MSNMTRRVWLVALSAPLILLLAACGSQPDERADVVSVTPTSVATTAPLSVPSTPDTAQTPVTLPEVTPTSVPTSTVAPTALPTATPGSDAAPASTEVPTATPTVETIEATTPVPTPTVAEPASAEAGEDGSSTDSDADAAAESTPVPATPTVVVAASGEPPLECYDADVQVYRGFVDGVDALSFEGGRVYCSGAGTNAVSAAGSYRHASGLIVHRNADFIFNDAGTAYIPYSGSLHFCVNGQPGSAPIRADTVPALLVVIDNEAQRQVAQGATGPSAFTGSGAQC